MIKSLDFNVALNMPHHLAWLYPPGFNVALNVSQLSRLITSPGFNVALNVPHCHKSFNPRYRQRADLFFSIA